MRPLTLYAKYGDPENAPILVVVPTEGGEYSLSKPWGIVERLALGRDRPKDAYLDENEPPPRNRMSVFVDQADFGYLRHHEEVLLHFCREREAKGQLVVIDPDPLVPESLRGFVAIVWVGWPDFLTLMDVVRKAEGFAGFKAKPFPEQEQVIEEIIFPQAATLGPRALFRLIERAGDERDLEALAQARSYQRRRLPPPDLELLEVHLPEGLGPSERFVPPQLLAHFRTSAGIEAGPAARVDLALCGEEADAHLTVDALIFSINKAREQRFTTGGRVVLLRIDAERCDPYSLRALSQDPLLRELVKARSFIAEIQGIEAPEEMDAFVNGLKNAFTCMAILFVAEQEKALKKLGIPVVRIPRHQISARKGGRQMRGNFGASMDAFLGSWITIGGQSERKLGRFLGGISGLMGWLSSQTLTVLGFVTLLVGLDAPSKIGGALSAADWFTKVAMLGTLGLAFSTGLMISAVEIIGRTRWENPFWNFFTKLAVAVGTLLSLAGVISVNPPSADQGALSLLVYGLVFIPVALVVCLFMEILPEPLLVVSFFGDGPAQRSPVERRSWETAGRREASNARAWNGEGWDMEKKDLRVRGPFSADHTFRCGAPDCSRRTLSIYTIDLGGGDERSYAACPEHATQIESNPRQVWASWSSVG